MVQTNCDTKITLCVIRLTRQWALMALLAVSADLFAEGDNSDPTAEHVFLTPDGPVPEKAFDHLSTGYPLTGHHKWLGCRNCHGLGNFEKLPTRCEECHNNRIAAGVPAGHIITVLPCDICHTTFGFVENLAMDHSISTASCINCHDGLVGRGKGALHIETTSHCERCHSSSGWSPVVRVDHNEVFSNCIRCHDNILAAGRLPTHISTTTNCETCHIINADSWKVIVMVDHNQVVGDCFGCHDNVTASGRPVSHLTSSNQCEACHQAGYRWKAIYRVDHRQIRGACRNCHQMPPRHVQTKRHCAACHVPETGWRL